MKAPQMWLQTPCVYALWPLALGLPTCNNNNNNNNNNDNNNDNNDNNNNNSMQTGAGTCLKRGTERSVKLW